MIRRLLAAALLAFTALAPGSAAADTIPVGDAMQVATIRGTALNLYTYRTAACSDPSLLVYFSGSARNAESARNAAHLIADARCYLVIAPEFDEARFPASWAYQQGGLVTSGGTLRAYDTWNVHYAADIVAWARANESRPTMPFYLYGHSAGAQFLSRMAATAIPAGVTRIVIANPSSHMLASMDDPALYDDVPYGYTGLLPEMAPVALMQAFLAAPVTIYLGTADNDPNDPELSHATAAEAQGSNRLDRGRFAFTQAKAKARANGWAFRWRLVEAQGIGHNSSEMLDATESASAFTPAPAAIPCGP